MIAWLCEGRSTWEKGVLLACWGSSQDSSSSSRRSSTPQNACTNCSPSIQQGSSREPPTWSGRLSTVIVLYKSHTIQIVPPIIYDRRLPALFLLSSGACPCSYHLQGPVFLHSSVARSFDFLSTCVKTSRTSQLGIFANQEDL